ncbi:MAG: LytR/AlgR family response regulator transcription factor [Raoultibacter sp.]|jgi:DNA-binding LytR/AlgR family response regulator
MRIAICDDDQSIIDLVTHYIDEWAKVKGVTSPEVETFNSSESFLFHWSSTTDFDLLFLDIKMSNMSGMELAHVVRTLNQTISIVFITGSREHILDGYEVGALHYLLKPISFEDCCKCLDRVEPLTAKIGEQSLMVAVDKKLQRILYSDIVYIESFSHYITIHTKTKEFRSRKGISEVEEELDSEQFLRIHRSYIVNVKYISAIGKKELQLENGETLPISQMRYQEINRAFIAFHV